MVHDKDNHGKEENMQPAKNSANQGVDKAPGEERGKEDQVTQKDLKGKKVDGDPTQEQDRPAS